MPDKFTREAVQEHMRRYCENSFKEENVKYSQNRWNWADVETCICVLLKENGLMNENE